MSLAYRHSSIAIEELRLRHNESTRLLIGYSIGVALICAAPILTVWIAAMGIAKCSSATSVKATLFAKSNAIASPHIASTIDQGWDKDNDVHYNESVRVWR